MKSESSRGTTGITERTRYDASKRNTKEEEKEN